MKKSLLFVSLFVTGASFSQDCSDLFISEYVEGSGNDKAIELYNPTASPINLSGYTLERHSNGDSDATNGGTLTLSGVIAAHDVFVIVNGQMTTVGTSPLVSPALQAMADLLDGVYPAPTYMNGNDAILLKKNGVMIDIIGMSGDPLMVSGVCWSDAFPYDGSNGAGAWWTKDHSLSRKATVKHGVAANPNPFIVTVEWDSLPKDTWTNLGSHTCDCLSGIGENSKSEFSIYPNPTNDVIYIKSSTEFNQALVFDIRGNKVLTFANEAKGKTLTVPLNTLEKGVYVLELQYPNSELSHKQIVVE